MNKFKLAIENFNYECHFELFGMYRSKKKAGQRSRLALASMPLTYLNNYLLFAICYPDKSGC